MEAGRSNNCSCLLWQAPDKGVGILYKSHYFEDLPVYPSGCGSTRNWNKQHLRSSCSNNSVFIAMRPAAFCGAESSDSSLKFSFLSGVTECYQVLENEGPCLLYRGALNWGIPTHSTAFCSTWVFRKSYVVECPILMFIWSQCFP